MLFEEGDALRRCADGYWDAEHAADTGTDEVGVVEVGERVTHDDGIDASGLCRPQDGSQIAGFLHTFEDDD